MKIPITKTLLDDSEQNAVCEVLKSGWIVQGTQVAEFEKRFSNYTKATHSIATTSCTTALHLAVCALGLKPGDEVIVPAFTWISTANVVEFEGAKPVFCDVSLDTFNIEPSALEAAITPRTVGIMPVHLFGLCADMDAILAIAEKHHLWVVEDAACGFGAYIDGRHAGTMSHAGCFSFHPRKSITTGEGGMLTTHDDTLTSKVRSLRDHGASRTDFERHHAKTGFLLPEYQLLGYNYRMTDIQGALGVMQMEKANQVLEARKAWAQRYDESLHGLNLLQLPCVPENYIHGYQSYVTQLNPGALTLGELAQWHEKRNRLMSRLEERGIATRQGTHAPPFLTFYREKYGYRHEMFPNAYRAEQLSISLPLFPQLEAAEHAYVVEHLKKELEAL